MVHLAPVEPSLFRLQTRLLMVQSSKKFPLRELSEITRNEKLGLTDFRQRCRSNVKKWQKTNGEKNLARVINLIVLIDARKTADEKRITSNANLSKKKK